MEDSDFESVGCGKTTENGSAANLDAEIDAVLNSKIDFSCADGEIVSNNGKNSPKIDKIEHKGQKNAQNLQKSTRKSADDEAERRINAIIDEFSEDVKIELGNIKEKAMMEPSLRGKWIRKYVLSKAREKRLKQNIEVLREEISKMYSSGGSFLSSRQTVDSALRNDEGIKELRRELYIESQVAETLSYCKDTIYGFGYSVKNSLEAIKLDMGI